MKKNMKTFYAFLCLAFLFSCANESADKATITESKQNVKLEAEVSLMLLGTLQDAGSPHIACKKDCCAQLFITPDPNRKVSIYLACKVH